MLMMDLYEEPCMLPDMIESDLQTDLGCGGELGSTHLPPLEGMGALDSLDPSWLTDPHGPLNSDLDSLDVGLMVNPQTGLPSLSSSSTMSSLGGLPSILTASSPSSSSSSLPSPVSSSISISSSSTISSNHPKKTIGGFTLLTATSSSTITSQSQPQNTFSVGNSASAATPVVSSGMTGGLIQTHHSSSSPQPLTASNVQALLGHSHSVDQGSQPAAKRSRLSEFEEIQAPVDNNMVAAAAASNAAKGFPKPAYSYSCLIAMALKNSKTGSLPVNEIYNFMIENFPYFKTAPNGWKNSVRHNLSLNKCFEKIEKPTTGPNGSQRKGCLWAMNPSKVGKMDEEVQKWSKKDPVAIRRSMAKPDRLELLEKGFLKDLYTGGDNVEYDDEEDVEDTGSSVDDDLEPMLPDTPPTSQDESGSNNQQQQVKVKVIDSALDKFEGSPWNTWETLQQQDENKPRSNFSLSSTAGSSSNKKGVVVNADGSTLCATTTPNTYIIAPSSSSSSPGQKTSNQSSLSSKAESKFKSKAGLIR